MKRLVPVIVAIVLIGTVIFFTIRRQPEPTVKLRVGYNVESLNFAPLVVAKVNQYFEQRQLRLRFIPLQSGKEVRQALVAGQVDIGTAGAGNFYAPMTKGAPITILAPMALTPTYVFVRPDGKLKTFQDLRGKTVAVSPGSATDRSFRSVLTKEGISATDLRFVDVEKEYKVLALLEKKSVDVVGVSEQEVPKMEAAGATILEEWKTKGYSRLQFPGIVVAVNAALLNEQSDLVRRFLEALVEGHRFIRDHQAEAARIVADHIRGETAGAITFSVDDIEKTWQAQRLAYTIWYDPQLLVDDAHIAFEVGEIERPLSLMELHNPRFDSFLQDAQKEVYASSR